MRRSATALLALLLAAGCAPSIPPCDSSEALQATAQQIVRQAVAGIPGEEIEETERGFRHLPTNRELIVELEADGLVMWEATDSARTMDLRFDSVQAGELQEGARQCSAGANLSLGANPSARGEVTYRLERGDDGALTATGTLAIDSEIVEF